MKPDSWPRILEGLAQIKAEDISHGKDSSKRLDHYLNNLCELAEVVDDVDEQVTLLTAFMPWSVEFVQKTLVEEARSANFGKSGLGMSKSKSSDLINLVVTARQAILQIYTVILPIYGEVLRPWIEPMVKCCMAILHSDVEDNGLLALHVLVDLHKLFRGQTLEWNVQELLDYVLGCLDAFGETTATQARRPHPTSSIPSTKSFKLLIECPVMIVLLFQLYRRFINDNIPRLIPAVLKALAVEPAGLLAATEESHPSHAMDDLVHLSQALLDQRRVIFDQFIAAQVKILSFLAYISRGFANLIKPHQESLPASVIRLLRICPPECASSRKELLVATRHILSTEVRQAFVPFMETMMEGRLLLGEGYTAFYVFRPMSLSMLADLIHHVRTDIDPGVLAKVVAMYAKALHDPTLPMGIQTMSAKLLLNLIDAILGPKMAVHGDSQKRNFLLDILSTMIYKFEWIGTFVKGLVEQRRDSSNISSDPNPSPSSSTTAMEPFDERLYDSFLDDPLNSRPIHSDLLTLDSNRDNLRDLRFLLRTLITGIKSILFALRGIMNGNNNSAAPASISPNANNNALPTAAAVPPSEGEPTPMVGCGLSIEEGQQFVRLLAAGIEAFDIFSFGSNGNVSQATGSGTIITSDQLHLNTATIPAEEKEILDQFAYLFTLVDAHVFQDALTANLDGLIRHITTQNPNLISIPQYFLAISGISRNFNSLLIRYLMEERLGDLANSTGTSSEGGLVLRLFKLVFLAVSVYPDENEIVLQPYLADLILACLRNHHRYSSSVNYFLLLRSLFRSIGGGRFDLLYKEVLPLLPVLLEELCRLPFSTNDPQLRDLYVELCLTTPVRLSVLLPYLSFLMKPLVLALQSNTDLVSQGLRTLELCIDNLTQDFLEPVLTPVLPDVLEALWGLLRPPPANQTHSHAAVRILGKMGGRCRRFCLEAPEISAEGCKEPFAIPGSSAAKPLSLDLSSSSGSVILNLSAAVKYALVQISGTEKNELMIELILFVVARLFGPDELAFLEQETKRADISALAIEELSFAHDVAHVGLRVKQTMSQVEELHNVSSASSLSDSEQSALETLCKDLLDCLFGLAATKDYVRTFLQHLFTMFARYESALNAVPRSDFANCLLKGAATALIHGLGCQSQTTIGFAKDLISQIYNLTIDQCTSRGLIEFPVIGLLSEQLIAACYHTSKAIQIGACQGFSLLCRLEPPLLWIWQYECRFVRGIFYIMKSLNHGEALRHGEEVSRCLYKLIKYCNRQESTNDQQQPMPDRTGKRMQYYNQLVALLVLELANSNGTVRNATQVAFQLLADALGSEVTELILPLKDRLLNPIFSKPLRALPLQFQTGYIDAVTYCLSLRPPILDISDELLRLLNEAIALADAEDHVLSGKSNSTTNQPQLYTLTNINNLRVVCVRVLSAAMSCADFQHPKLQQLRNLIVSVFFKSLYSKSPEVVEASRGALEQIISHQHKLPKDLLQTGLRPVLMNLAETKRLSVVGLDGLKRVLVLLTSYFKAEIGKKLLDHLAAWTDHRSLEEMRSRPIFDSPEVRAITSLFEVFPLLPPSSHVFNLDLVNAMLELEKSLLRQASSPLRRSLARFFAQHPVESVQFMLAEQASNQAIWTIWTELLLKQQPEVILPLIQELQTRILETFQLLATAPDTSSHHSLRIAYLGTIQAVLSVPSEKLHQQAIYPSLFQMWRVLIERGISMSVQPASLSELAMEFRVAFEIVKNFIILYPNHLEAPFLLLEVFNVPLIVEISGLPGFLRQHWLQKVSSRDDLQKILVIWLDMMVRPDLNFLYKSRITRLIALPILARFRDSQEPLDDAVWARMENSIWMKDCRACTNGACVIAVEELQVSQIILGSGLLGAADRKRVSLIRHFLQNRLQSLDPTVKNMALCVMASHPDRLGLREDEVLATLKMALKSPSSETRPIIRQCLLQLLDSIEVRTGLKAQVAEVLARTLSRETNVLSLVIIIWQVLVAKRDAIQSLGHILLKSLITSLYRCSLNVFAIAENRNLPFDIYSLIIEMIAPRHPKTEEVLAECPALYDYAFNGLLRLFSAANEFVNDGGSRLFERGLGLLVSGFEVMPAERIRPKYGIIEKLIFIERTDESSTTISLMGGRLLQVILDSRPRSIYFSDLTGVLKAWKHVIHSTVQSSLGTSEQIIQRYYGHLEESKNHLKTSDEDRTEAHAGLSIIALELLSTGGRGMPVGVIILKAFLKISDPLKMALELNPDVLVTTLSRAFAKLAGELAGRQEFGQDPSEQYLIVHFIVPAIGILAKYISQASFNRQVVLTAWKQLWQHSSSPLVTEALLGQMSRLMAAPDEPFPTLKEKSEILLLPSRLIDDDQDVAATCQKIYFEIVLLIYQTSAYQDSDLTWRMEVSFLRGLLHKNPEIRRSFFALLDAKLPKDLFARLLYLFGVQNWHLLGSTVNWMPALIWLTLAALKDGSTEENFEFPKGVRYSAGGITDTLAEFCHESSDLSMSVLIDLLPQVWAQLSPTMRTSLAKVWSRMLASEDYLCLSRMRPSSIQMIVEAICSLDDGRSIGLYMNPMVLAYTAKYYSTWHSSIVSLERMLEASSPAARSSLDEQVDRDSIVALLKLLYGSLNERDMHHGLIRRETTFLETNAAISFVQGGKWTVAQRIFEQAQQKARNGQLAYSEVDFSCWEQGWIDCAKRLQQWDLLADLAKMDEDTDLGLECLWRMGDWSQSETQAAVMGNLRAGTIVSARIKAMEAFLILNQKEVNDRSIIFQGNLEEAIQLSLNEWTFLPETVSWSHLPLLEQFQQFVELQESMQIYLFLSGNSNSLMRPQFLTDLKGLLATWRERLPNKNDDVNVWSDLLAWRQHVFTTLNVSFQSLLVTPSATNSGEQTSQQAGGAASPAATAQHPFAFRGYHEMAWLINRFSRVARKNRLIDVCLSFLNRIYTLPNIEIQDAFLKLREQAKCYMETPGDLPTALEVINATNLNYFNGTQKGEFFALKAVVLSRLGMLEEANRVFAQAVQIDLNIGRGWSGWGYYNDQRFLQGQELNFAVNAVNCYLQAAALFKVEQSRKYLARILWLFTFEDAAGSLGKSFELYNNDLPTWYWVFFIPQLLLSLSRRDAKQAKFVLIKIAKSFPQALFVPLRAYNEDLRLFYGPRLAAIQQQRSSKAELPNGEVGVEPQAEESTVEPTDVKEEINTPAVGTSTPPPSQAQKKSPLDHFDDITAVLKTAYPLLALSMETIIENIVQRLRSSADEDFYRVIVTLIAEGYQQMVLKFNTASAEQPPTAAANNSNGLESSLKRVSFMLSSAPYLANMYKQDFDRDFIEGTVGLRDVLNRLHAWRQRLYPLVSSTPSKIPLESLSRVLSEIEYQSYDEIDIFGQYNMLRDSPNDFAKMACFEPVVNVIRRHGTSYRRICIKGHDGSTWRFVVQNPSARQSRREERIMQLLQVMDNNSKRGINARNRGLKFSIPYATPISAHVRLVAEEADLTSLESILQEGLAESSCSRVSSDDLVLYYNDMLAAEIGRLEVQLKKGNSDLLNLRTDLFQVLSPQVVPLDLLRRYMTRLAPNQNRFWNFRLALTRQYASCIFSAYALAFGHRYLHKLLISKKRPIFTQTDLLPTLNPNGQITLMEAVPVRLTPNLQEYFTENGVESILVPAVQALAEVLAVPESDTCEYAALFVRDELLAWLLASQPAYVEGNLEMLDDLSLLEANGIDERQLLGRIMQNCELIMKRIQTLACIKEEEKALETVGPYYQTILDILSCATNPQKLALMDPHWHPWF